MITKEKILITVKTYPTLSSKYGELVCTAGVREDGSWVRLYPVPFRKLEDYKQYKKYQWLSAPLSKRKKDPRLESFVPDRENIELGELLGTKNQWAERCRIILENGTVYDDMTALIRMAKDNKLSLATYKPKEIFDLVVEKVDRDWPEDKLKAIKEAHRQGELFADDNQFEEELKLVRKLPYKFSYKFADKDGKGRTLMIEDWEIGALYWNCLASVNGDEKLAVQKVRQKYIDEFLSKTDLHLFVGTTQLHHFTAPNPFVIIGTFTPPKNRHPELKLWG